MTDERIGGHEGMTVYRTQEGIKKVATTDEAWNELANEAGHLSIMEGQHAPRLFDHSPGGRFILQEDLGDALSLVRDPIVRFGAEQFFNDCVDLLLALRRNWIYHGDLTPPNLAWTEHRGLCALDWQESSLLGSSLPRKRPTTDSWQMLDTYVGLGFRLPTGTGHPERDL